MSILSFERGYSCEDKTYQQKSPLKQECEDSYFCNKEKKIYGVCDGATPLVPFRDEKGHNGHTSLRIYLQVILLYYERIIVYNLQLPKRNEALQSKMLEYEVDTRKKSICGAHVSRQSK